MQEVSVKIQEIRTRKSKWSGVKAGKTFVFRYGQDGFEKGDNEKLKTAARQWAQKQTPRLRIITAPAYNDENGKATDKENGEPIGLFIQFEHSKNFSGDEKTTENNQNGKDTSKENAKEKETASA